MKLKSKKLFFSFLFCLLFVSFFGLVGSASALGTLVEVSAMYGYGSAPVGGTVYNYLGNHTDAYFVGSVYQGNLTDINGDGSYTLYANVTDGGLQFSGTLDVYYSQQVTTDLFNYMFSTFTYDHSLDMTTLDYYYSGYDASNVFNAFTNLPDLSELSETTYFAVRLNFYNGLDVYFDIYYVFVVDDYLSSPPAPSTSVLPTATPYGGGVGGVDWLDGSGFADLPVIAQMVLFVLLVIGVPCGLLVMVPKVGMPGFVGVMSVCVAIAVFFLGMPYWLLIFSGLGIGVMLFGLMYRS